MSNFQTLSPITGGVPGTAASMFVAVTTDTAATIVTAGYVEDLVTNGVLKVRDILYITYSDGTDDVATQSYTVTETSGGSLVTGLSVLGMKVGVGTIVDSKITDPFVTPTSIVIANFQTQAGASALEEVIPDDGFITFSYSGSPGTSTVQYVVFN